jgi:hypothetical protein
MIYIEWKLRRIPPPNFTVIFVTLNAVKDLTGSDTSLHVNIRIEQCLII